MCSDVAVEPGRGDLLGGQERRRHHLGDPEADEHAAEPAAALLDRREVAVQRRLRHELRDVARSRSGARPPR